MIFVRYWPDPWDKDLVVIRRHDDIPSAIEHARLLRKFGQYKVEVVEEPPFPSEL